MNDQKQTQNVTAVGVGSTAFLGSVPIQEYKPELWTVDKSAIYAAKTALADGIEYTRELLANHDRDKGRGLRSNKVVAEHMEASISGMQVALIGLRPYATPEDDSA